MISFLFYFVYLLYLDINECSNSNSCHSNATCKNSDGSYTCTCMSGYSGNGTHCTDNNECNDTPKPCSSLVNCTNTAGSYMCHACPSGYSGNGTVCDGMNIFPLCFFVPLTCFIPDEVK